MLGGQEGHRRHRGKGARKADFSVQCGCVPLMVLRPPVSYLYWSFLQVDHFLVRGAVESVIYVMRCYFTFGTGVIVIAANPTQVRFQQGRYPVLSCVNRIRAIRGSVCSTSAVFGGLPSFLISLFSCVWTMCRLMLLGAYSSRFICFLLLVCCFTEYL